MKLKTHSVERKGNNLKIASGWADRMRRPGGVTILSAKNTPIEASTLIDGDASDVMSTLSGIAKIAWDLGWRPDGLEANISAALRDTKG